VSEPVDERELFSDPARLFLDGPAAKEAHQRHLAEILTAPPEPRPGPDEVDVDALVDRIAGAVAERLEKGAA
jgi:hypothetical protein